MFFIKIFMLMLILGGSSYIGIVFSKKYFDRAKELKDMKNALNMFATKIKFTYEPIPSIFSDISLKIDGNVSKIFNVATTEMKDKQAGEAWNYALDNVNTNMNNEDKGVIKNLGRMLGQTDLDGQLSEIELVSDFLDTQIQKAESERSKNEKMYRTLGIVVGLTIVIILI